MDKELLDYIKDNKKKGFSDEQIKKALLDTGWKEEMIDEGMKNVGRATSNIKPFFLKKKLPGWVFLLFAIGSAVIIVLVAWQSMIILSDIHQISIEIAEASKNINWKTYQSINLGLELKYPRKWNLQEEENQIVIKQEKNELSLTLEKVIVRELTNHGNGHGTGFDAERELIEETVRIGDIDTEKRIYQITDLAVKRFSIYFNRGYAYQEGNLEIGLLHYRIWGKYFVTLEQDEIEKLDIILASMKFTAPQLSKEEVKKQVCETQPNLIRLSYKDDDVANKVFVEAEGLKPLTPKEWEVGGYKWPCVKKYYIEDIPYDVLYKLPESNFFKKIITDIDDWKTYSNSDFGIEFKYPPHWAIEENLAPPLEDFNAWGHLDTQYNYAFLQIDDSFRYCKRSIKSIETINLLVGKTFIVTSEWDNLNLFPDLYGKVCYHAKISGKQHNFYLEFPEGEEEAYVTILSTFKFIP